MKIIYKPIEEVKPYVNNPRKNRRTINKLKELLQGNVVEFDVPIVVDKEGVIIKGHSRYTALCELGYTEVPVIISDKSDEINAEDRLHDNMIQELSTWKESELTLEIRELGIEPGEYDINIRDLGYDTGKRGKDVTSEDVVKAESGFLRLGVNDTKEYIELICPNCGEEFMVDRKEVRKL